MSEAETVESEVTEPVQQEQATNTGEESTPKSESTYLNLDSLPEDMRGQVQGRLGEMTRKRHALEGDNKRLMDEKKQLEEQLRELKKPKEVKAPSADDAIDDPVRFARQQEEFAQYLRDQERYEGEVRLFEKDRQRAEQAEQARKAEELTQQAATAGIDITRAHNASNVFVDALERTQPMVADILRNEVLDSDKAIAIMVHLADNPMQLYDITSSSAGEALRKLDSVKHQLSKPQKPIDPPDDLKGGSPPDDLGDFIAEFN
jgi:hypothetical protein